jgi:hypothetical protein
MADAAFYTNIFIKGSNYIRFGVVEKSTTSFFRNEAVQPHPRDYIGNMLESWVPFLT